LEGGQEEVEKVTNRVEKVANIVEKVGKRVRKVQGSHYNYMKE
jgi:ppGpp synthetase/RelA/SpoT-type nucleotidyltranferase